MAKGVIYCMTTIVPGLVKIGKTGIDSFENRMYSLERNGYANIVGLKRRFAIAVADYDEKEALLHNIFAKSNVPNTELFAINDDLVVQLLSSFEGEQIFPKTITKEDVFDIATDEIRANSTTLYTVPDGEYHISKRVKAFKNKSATMVVENRKFIVKKGSFCLPCSRDWMPQSRKEAIIENDILKEDVVCHSPSTAGWVVLGNANNGWKMWENLHGELIDKYRTKQ